MVRFYHMYQLKTGVSKRNSISRVWSTAEVHLYLGLACEKGVKLVNSIPWRRLLDPRMTKFSTPFGGCGILCKCSWKMWVIELIRVGIPFSPFNVRLDIIMYCLYRFDPWFMVMYHFCTEVLEIHWQGKTVIISPEHSWIYLVRVITICLSSACEFNEGDLSFRISWISLVSLRKTESLRTVMQSYLFLFGGYSDISLHAFQYRLKSW